MRLIDADALKTLIFDKSIPVDCEDETGKKDCVLGMLLGDIYECIDNAPTVEPTEEITNDDIQLAIKTSFQDGYEMAKAKFGGADMRGGEE